MKKIIVIDKSFLINKNSETVKNLCLKNDVYMPYDLFLELIYSQETEKIQKRAECFRKFPQIENPVILGKTIGELFHYEINNNTECPSLLNFQENKRFRFNKDLSEPSLKCLSDDDVTIEIQRWLKELCERTNLYKRSSAEVCKWFPNIRSYKPGQPEIEIKKAKEIVLKDNKFVLNCYSQIIPREYPDSSLLNEKWILFIWMKTNLIYAINYIKKYGADSILNSKQHSHDVLDIEYCMLGILGNGLATCDEDIKDCFKFLCSGGILIS